MGVIFAAIGIWITLGSIAYAFILCLELRETNKENKKKLANLPKPASRFNNPEWEKW